MRIVRAHVYISGIVQGVFFRASTLRVAKQLGLKGFVRNVPISFPVIAIIIVISKVRGSNIRELRSK